MRRLLLGTIVAGTASAQVHFTHEKDRVIVSTDTRPFGTLYFGKEANNHPHQKGLSMGVERLNGMDFWENDKSYTCPRMGKIVFNHLARLEPGAAKANSDFSPAMP